MSLEDIDNLPTALLTFWRVIKFNLWARNFALKGTVRSLLVMRVRVVVVLGIILGFLFVVYCVQNVLEVGNKFYPLINRLIFV